MADDSELERQIRELRYKHAKAKIDKYSKDWMAEKEKISRSNTDGYVVMEHVLIIPRELEEEVQTFAWGPIHYNLKPEYVIGIPYTGDLPVDHWGNPSRPLLGVGNGYSQFGKQPMVFPSKDVAEDLAYALNAARWMRTKPKEGGKDI